MPLFIDFPYDGAGMVAAIREETGLKFTWSSGSSESLCTFTSLMPLRTAHAFKAYLHRLPKDRVYADNLTVTIIEVVQKQEPAPPPPTMLERILKRGTPQSAPAQPEPEPMAELHMEIAAPFTVELRDLVKQCRFYESDYRYATEQLQRGKTSSRQR